jgi:hypothetical protein
MRADHSGQHIAAAGGREARAAGGIEPDLGARRADEAVPPLEHDHRPRFVRGAQHGGATVGLNRGSRDADEARHFSRVRGEHRRRDRAWRRSTSSARARVETVGVDHRTGRGQRATTSSTNSCVLSSRPEAGADHQGIHAGREFEHARGRPRRVAALGGFAERSASSLRVERG